MRQVTGSDEPAMKAKPSSTDWSYIWRAQSQFQERCLSLKTGADRPVVRYTETICWKNSYRG